MRHSPFSLAALMLGASCASSPPQTTAAPAQPVAAASTSPAKPAPLPTALLPGVGMSTSNKKPDVEEDDDDPLSGPVPSCAKDEDCWSKSCCPAKAPEDCVHASRARKCAIVDVQCKPTPIHYTCVCDAGACKGRLAPP